MALQDMHSGHSGVGLMVGLNGLEGLFPAKMIL